MSELVSGFLPDGAESIGEYEQAVAAVNGQNAAGERLDRMVAAEEVATPWLISMTREHMQTQQQPSFRRVIGAFAALPIDNLLHLRDETASRRADAESRLERIEWIEDEELARARHDADVLSELVADLRPQLLEAVELEVARRRQPVEAEIRQAQELDEALGKLLSMPIPQLIAADVRQELASQVELEELPADRSNDGAIAAEAGVQAADDDWLRIIREDMTGQEELGIGGTIGLVAANHVGQVIPYLALARHLYGMGDDKRNLNRLNSYLAYLERDTEGRSAPLRMLRERGLMLQRQNGGVAAVSNNAIVLLDPEEPSE